jgi:chromosomal replication initiation ATPase DnaA
MDRFDWHADQDWRKIVGEIKSENEVSIQAEVARRTGSSGLPLIATIAATITGVEVEEMRGSGRHPDVVDARTIYSGVARALTTCSFPEIARGLCRSAHSTFHPSSGEVR